jgi:hypothetical protein
MLVKLHANAATTPDRNRRAYDQVCQAHGGRRKLTRPYRPQTNGRLERFNRRLAEALQAHPRAKPNRGRNRFDDPAQRDAFILGFVADYNRTRLRCLSYQAPREVLDLTGHNTKAGTQTFEIARPRARSRTRNRRSHWGRVGRFAPSCCLW